jgi:hypothetical protein
VLEARQQQAFPDPLAAHVGVDRQRGNVHLVYQQPIPEVSDRAFPAPPGCLRHDQMGGFVLGQLEAEAPLRPRQGKRLTVDLHHGRKIVQRHRSDGDLEGDGAHGVGSLGVRR